MRRKPTFEFERAWRQRGARVILGVDEAGAGALAGPVVAAVALVPTKSRLGELRDSKQLTHGRRVRLLDSFSKHGIKYAVGMSTVKEINNLGIRKANLQAMKRAVIAFSEKPDVVLVDWYTIPDLPCAQEAITKGDMRVKSIAAASIVAKVTRDQIMIELNDLHPEYGFANHKGYATRAHVESLKRCGVTEAHRRQFVRTVLAKQ